MVVQACNPSAAKVETGGSLRPARQPGLVDEFQILEKLLLRDTNKTSGLHIHTRVGGRPAYAVTPQEICICLSVSESHRHLECLYSDIKMAASSGNLRPDVQWAPVSSPFDKLLDPSMFKPWPRILVLRAPRKGAFQPYQLVSF